MSTIPKRAFFVGILTLFVLFLSGCKSETSVAIAPQTHAMKQGEEMIFQAKITPGGAKNRHLQLEHQRKRRFNAALENRWSLDQIHSQKYLWQYHPKSNSHG